MDTEEAVLLKEGMENFIWERLGAKIKIKSAYKIKQEICLI